MSTLFPEEQAQTIYPDNPEEELWGEQVNEQPTDNDEPYEFATGDLSSFIHDFNEEKEEMGIDQKPTPEEFEETGKPSVPATTARKTGRFVANMTDYALATGLSLISKQDPDIHKADPDSKKELENIITEYIKESGGEIPIGVQLVICLLVTYGLQIPGAIRLRKQANQTNMKQEQE